MGEICKSRGIFFLEIGEMYECTETAKNREKITQICSRWLKQVIRNVFGGWKSKSFFPKGQIGKSSTESEKCFGNRGNLKQGEMHHCIRGEWTPLTRSAGPNYESKICYIKVQCSEYTKVRFNFCSANVDQLQENPITHFNLSSRHGRKRQQIWKTAAEICGVIR